MESYTSSLLLLCTRKKCHMVQIRYCEQNFGNKGLHENFFSPFQKMQRANQLMEKYQAMVEKQART